MTLSDPTIPHYYQSGSRLVLWLEGSFSSVSMDVVHPITPVTMSQILLVQISSREAEDQLNLPPGTSFIIIKIYDPRVHQDRREPDTLEPWSYTAEYTAAQRRGNKGWDPNFKPWIWPKEGDTVGWEEWYYQNAERQYHYELSAYQRLEPLQGTSIPRCYGTGTLQLPDRAISPHFLLLEYIPDAKTVETVGLHKVDLSIARTLLNTVDRMHELGVIHSDFSLGNILFTPGDRPSRGVIIDFGESGYRLDNVSDAKWEELAKTSGDSAYMKLRFKRFLGLDLDSETAAS